MLKKIAAGITSLAVAAVCTIAVAANITGAGATFPKPIYLKWADTYKATGNQVNYQGIGSGAGIKQIEASTVDFGASDKPLTPDDLAANGLVQFPTVIGGVVPIVNLPGIAPGQLKLTGPVLADIYRGVILFWDDPHLTAMNPGLKLPHMKITVVHRADGSGTTYTWVDYLSKLSGEFQKKIGVGTSVTWPVGLGGKGNEGVAGLVRQTPGSIGYVELIYALQNKIDYAPVKNAAGVFVNASLETVSAAAATAQIPADYRVSITNAPGKNVYPISTFTWILASPSIQDPAKKKALYEFLIWAVTKGQTYSKDLGYAPLPKSLVDRELKDIAKLK